MIIICVLAILITRFKGTVHSNYRKKTLSHLVVDYCDYDDYSDDITVWQCEDVVLPGIVAPKMWCV